MLTNTPLISQIAPIVTAAQKKKVLKLSFFDYSEKRENGWQVCTDVSLQKNIV